MTTLTWPLRLIGFAFVFARLLLVANWQVLRDIFTPGSSIEAGIARVPTRCRTDLEITMFANLISLTPGTLTLAVRRGEPTVLYVHGMYAPDPDAFRAELGAMETALLRAMRRDGAVE